MPKPYERSDALNAYLAVQRLHARTARIRSGALIELGLTHARLKVLRIVFEQPGMSIAAIARILDLSRQAVHRVTHQLEDAKLLMIRHLPHNHRDYATDVTHLGAIVAKIALGWEDRWTAECFDNLTAGILRETRWYLEIVRQALPWTVRGADDFSIEPIEPPGVFAREYAARATAFPRPPWERQ